MKMEKYFYLFGGVIIGTVFSYYYFKNEDIDDEDISDDECMHSHVVNSQSILCEPEVIKLKSM